MKKIIWIGYVVLHQPVRITAHSSEVYVVEPRPHASTSTLLSSAISCRAWSPHSDTSLCLSSSARLGPAYPQLSQCSSGEPTSEPGRPVNRSHSIIELVIFLDIYEGGKARAVGAGV